MSWVYPGTTNMYVFILIWLVVVPYALCSGRPRLNGPSIKFQGYIYKEYSPLCSDNSYEKQRISQVDSLPRINDLCVTNTQPKRLKRVTFSRDTVSPPRQTRGHRSNGRKIYGSGNIEIESVYAQPMGNDRRHLSPAKKNIRTSQLPNINVGSDRPVATSVFLIKGRPVTSRYARDQGPIIGYRPDEKHK